MKKLIVSLLLAAILLVVCAACKTQMFETAWTFDQAQILMPDGTVVSGKVESWRDYMYGDMLQVKIDGQFYLTHSANVVLWTEK